MERYTTIRSGSLIMVTKLAEMPLFIANTSLVILDINAPVRSLEKYPMESSWIFLYRIPNIPHRTLFHKSHEI